MTTSPLTKRYRQNIRAMHAPSNRRNYPQGQAGTQRKDKATTGEVHGQPNKGCAMLIEIKNRWSDAVIFSHDCEDNTREATLLEAIKSGADLRGANLRGADLRDANLSDADLRGADLSDANLRGADLRDANLSGADLRGADLRDANLSDADLRDANLSDADLRGANLRDADLRGADLRGANLRDADLRGADLRGANLRDADLRGANLTPIRDDIWAVLSSAPAEVPALIAALKEGRVDGSTYSGECACLVGTIANVRHADIQSLGDLKPNASRPAERFFLGISRGDKPETNQASALAVEWCEAWLSRMQAAFGQQG